MPSLEDIRKFNTRLVSLGDEPAVVAEWGEELEDVPEPEEGMDEELSNLLDDDLDSDTPPDFNDLLNEEAESPLDFDDPFDVVDSAPADEQPADDLSDGDDSSESDEPFDLDDSFDLDDAFGTDDGSEADDTFATDDTFGTDDTIETDDTFGTDDTNALMEGFSDDLAEDDESEVDATADNDDFEMPEDDLFGSPGDAPSSSDDSSDEIEDDFALPEGLLGEEPDVPQESTFESDDDFSFDDVPEAADADDDIDSFDDLSFDDDASEPDSPTEDVEELAAPDDGLDELEDAGEDDFELPDEFSDFGDTDFDDTDFGDTAPDAEFALPDTEPAVEESSGEDDDPLADGNGFDLSDEDDFGLPEGGFSLDDDHEPESSGDNDEFGGFEISDDDDFSFDAPPVVPGDESAANESAAPLEDIEEDQLDEFSLGDFGAEFGVLDEAGPSDEELNPAINVPDIAAAAPGPTNAPGDFQLSDQEFSALKSTLATFPLNLKLAVEQLIGEAKGTTEQVEKLCRMLVAGKGAADVATYVGRITGKQIRIPRGYEKQTGIEFEQERNSFAYQFRENVWPVLRLVGIALILLTGLGVAGYNFVYRPLLARSLYADGIEYIENDQYTLGNETFSRAWEVWPQTSWYYEYAETFISERQYTLAQEKYQELLFGRSDEEQDAANAALAAGQYEAILRVREPEKQGILDYATLESDILGNYPRAERLLQLILVEDVADYEGRLALGDNYLNWAEEDPSRFEQARLSYARLMERYGQTDELLFRMMRYFIRTDNLEQALVLKDVFQNDPDAQIEPAIYTELAGYLIDQDQISGVEDVLFRVLDTDNTLPEVHYQLARYYREIQALGEEALALQTADTLLSQAEPFTPVRRGMLIDTLTRIGENEYRVGAYLDAQERFGEAIELYEEGIRRRVLSPDPTYARAYSRLGDIFYYVGREFESALAQYDNAEQNGYDTSDQDYRQGFVHYRLGEVDDALGEFREAERDPAAVTNALLWSMANTHYRRENYFAAEAFYDELLDRVELQRDRIRTLLLDEDPTHQSIIEYLYKGYNNIGVAYYRLSQQNPQDAALYSDSLVALTRSTEIAENYQRDPDTLSRTEAVDLAYLNQREALFPTPNYEMQIYNDIPEDLDDLLF
jgi:hypothetical protein